MTAQVEDAARAAIESLAGTHEHCEPPGLIERYTAWSDGRTDEAMGFAIAYATTQSSERIAAALFDLSILCEHAQDRGRKFRKVADWGYAAAASYASSGRQRYRLDWGRVAARDGLALAMWDDAKTEVPTTVARAEQFSVGERKFRYTRKHVMGRANELIEEFRGFLGRSAKSPD